MRVAEMASQTVALRSLRRNDALAERAARRVVNPTRSPAEDPVGFVRGDRLRTDASTALAAAAAARHHLGAFGVADAALGSVHATLVALRDEVLSGTATAATTQVRLDEIAATLTTASFGSVRLFDGQPGTAREFVAGVAAAAATSGSYRSPDVTVDAAALEGFAEHGVSIEMVVDGEPATVLVAPTAGYADVAEFVDAVAAQLGEGVTVTFDGSAFTFSSVSTGVSSQVEIVGASMFAGGVATQGTDEVLEVEQVDARDNLALQFRIQIDRPAPPAPDPDADPDLDPADPDPDAGYVVPADQLSVSIERVTISTLGLDGFDPTAPDALERLDVAMSSVVSLRAAIGVSSATLERIADRSESVAVTLGSAAQRVSNNDTVEAIVQWRAATLRRDVAAQLLAHQSRFDMALMDTLLGGFVDVRV